MRMVGKRREAPPGFRYPTEAEIQRTVEFSRGIVYQHKKGVVRYRNHAEASAAMEELQADAMARRSFELTRGKRPVFENGRSAVIQMVLRGSAIGLQYTPWVPISALYTHRRQP